MKATELARVQQYLRNIFGTERIILNATGRKDDSAEVILGGEFLGVIFRDEEDGDISYAFHMAIMEDDLPEVRVQSPR